MILKEYEGKKLLTNVGLKIPTGVLVSFDQIGSKLNEIKKLNFPVFVKAQVLHGNRELEGLVIKIDDVDLIENKLSSLFAKKDRFGGKINHLLIEEMVEFSNAMYLGISYHTKTRTAVIQYSDAGGTGMDDRGDQVLVYPVSIINGPTDFPANPELLPTLQKIFEAFKNNDANLVEINPLVKTDDGFMCLDAKIELEDTASYRHPEWADFGERSAIEIPHSATELKAREISRMDSRGVAGESFFEFSGGNIGVMASGGGASTLAMDALLSQGLKPANYTEYSGNPTREKVHALCKLVLDLPNLEALYVVGSNANFTDIYETLAGVVDGLLEKDLPKGFKILIRRGGPRWQEAFEMVKERLKDKDIKLKLFGPDFSIVKTAKELKKMFDEDKD